MKNLLQWKNICLEVPYRNSYKQILHNLSGEVSSGNMMALMGSSGSGKTSFLKILSGRIPKKYLTSGEIKFNKERRNLSFVNITSFLEQEHFYSEYYDVISYLKFTMGCFGNNDDLELDKLLIKLHLEKVRFTKLAKLSGGEKKRVIVANELLSKKSILFLDEPTTGLDSHLALELIIFLYEITKERNLIVILSIHQPSTTILRFFGTFAESPTRGKINK